MTPPRSPQRGHHAGDHGLWGLGRLVVAAATFLAIASLALEGHRSDQQAAAPGVSAPTPAGLVPTVHPPLPTTLSALWLASSDETAETAPALRALARGVRLLEDDDPAGALPLVSAGALASTSMADYGRYYTGLALRRLERLDEAEAVFAALAAKRLDGHLGEDAALRHAEVREAKEDYAGAIAIYEQHMTRRVSQPQVWAGRLGAAAEVAGSREKAITAYRRAYDEFPMTAEAGEAERALTRLDAWDQDWSARAPREIARAGRLFTARRFSAARSSYERIRDRSKGGQRDLALVRLAAIDVLTGRGRRARAVLAAHRQDPGDVGLEAQFYHLGAMRAAGQHAQFTTATRAFVNSHPGSTWAEEALNNLATHYILVDEDDRAEAVFNEMLTRFPTGSNAGRAAWRAGWWAYLAGDYKSAVRIFEQGSTTSPRSNYRPAWLYWSARAFDHLNDRDAATERYILTATDYLNSYYGRLAASRLKDREITTIPPGLRRMAITPDTSALPPTTARIQGLIALGLDRAALNELLHGQRMWGDSPRLQATVALMQNRLGDLRPGINAMRRAYPQFIASGGERLPTEILEVIFPLSYWPLLRKHAAAKNLDPFLLAALVAQESTFDPAIRSSANAIGLMQILPRTGRQYARKLGIRPFSTRRLTEPEVNVRIGTTYFAELAAEFGGVHYALASYNAGESRVRRWRAERASLKLAQDEFIDDIPFPETQNYVKRILGTAEDYRRLHEGRTTPTTNGDP